MATQLRKLKLTRVDLVDKGANQHARVTLFKRADETIDKRIVMRAGEHCVMSEDGSTAMGCYPTHAAAMARLQQVEAHKRAVLDAVHADDPARLDAAVKALIQGVTPMADPKVPTTEDIQKQIDSAIQKALDASNATWQEKLQAVEKGATDKIEAVKKEAAEQVTKAEAKAQAERDIRETKEFADLAKSLSPVVQTDEAELLRKVANTIDAETWGKVKAMFARAAEQVRASKLLETAGSDQGGIVADSAAAEVMKRAEAIVAKGDLKLTREQAVQHVIDTDAALAKRYLDEARKGQHTARGEG